MKKQCYYLLSCLLAWTATTGVAIAQNPPPVPPGSVLQYYCQPGPGYNRFTETPVITDDALITQETHVYRSAAPWDSPTPVDLELDIYYPDTLQDPLQKRPFILMIYGGGFSTGNRFLMTKYCMDFARRGYVSATIDYRTGKDLTKPCEDPISGDPDPYSDEKAQYRAIQDADAAMRYIVKHAAHYKIDKSWLFAGGGSAGAGIANGLVYVTQDEADGAVPIDLLQLLGPLKGTGNNYTIKGIFNNWGGITGDFFDADEAVPMVAFHGTGDKTVPFRFDKRYDNKIPQCGLNDSIMGSAGIADSLDHYNICYDLTLLAGAGHGVWNNTTEGYQFRVGRAACFFKSLMCHTCNPANSYLKVVPPGHADDYDTPDGPDRAHCSTNNIQMRGASPAAVEESFFPAGITLVPNPASGSFHIRSLLPSVPYTATLSDNTGRQLRTYSQVTATSTLSLSGIPQGLYFIRVKKADGSCIANLKLIVQ